MNVVHEHKLFGTCHTSQILVVGDRTRRVAEVTPQVTLITDLDLQDGTSLDGYFQFIYDRGTTMAGMRELVHDGVVMVRAPYVWILMGNNQIPLCEHISSTSQMKKLVTQLLQTFPLTIQMIYVGTVLPREDREVELEAEVKKMGHGFAQGVQDLRRHAPHISERVQSVAVHKLFLECFKYFDLVTGHRASHLRIVKPVYRYFVPGTPKLNPVGLYHLKSYILQYSREFVAADTITP